MWPPECTQDSNQNMTFDPVKDGPLGPARYNSIESLKAIHQEMELLERAQKCDAADTAAPAERC